MKLKIKDKLGNTVKIKTAKEIIINLPYLETKTLQRALSKNQIKILDGDGELEILLSNFDIDGLTTGLNLSFNGKIFIDDLVHDVKFTGLDIYEIDGKKYIGEQNETKRI